MDFIFSDFYQHVPVFGKPIEDHLERSNRTIALVIEECVKNLITLGGLEEEVSMCLGHAVCHCQLCVLFYN